MFCPRINHYVRLNQQGTIGKCGHMVNAPYEFKTFRQLEDSEWLKTKTKEMKNNKWPEECVRCRLTEQSGGKSVRQASLDRHRLLSPLKNDYLIVGGVLDNICNSACQTCKPDYSTKIGSLQSREYIRVDNSKLFKELPQDRIVEIDINGGEPTASKNYRALISSLPPSTKIVRMNTNGSRMISELEGLLDKGIKVIVTLSMDGIGKVHDYLRWPIEWSNYEKTLAQYLELQQKHKLLSLDTWTTVSCLNLADLPNIEHYTRSKGLQHNWAFLEYPYVYNVRYKNRFTESMRHLFPKQIAIREDNDSQLQKFIAAQDKLRGIDIKDYLSFLPN